jgi:hypothetical protein
MSDQFWYGVAAGVGILGWMIIIVVFFAMVAMQRAKNREGRK